MPNTEIGLIYTYDCITKFKGMHYYSIFTLLNYIITIIKTTKKLKSAISMKNLKVCIFLPFFPIKINIKFIIIANKLIKIWAKQIEKIIVFALSLHLFI